MKKTRNRADIELMPIIELIELLKKYRVDDDILDFISFDGSKTYTRGGGDHNIYTDEDIDLFDLANPGGDPEHAKIICWIGEDIKYDKSRNEKQGIK